MGFPGNPGGPDISAQDSGMVEPDISTGPERSVPDPHWSEHSGAQRYSGAKATKVPEKDGRESERFIVP
jgi:hypothetical protein